MSASGGRGSARVDVAVVGAGPAGLAAAVRARWIKGHGAVPLRVAVFDPAPPGGLAGWKPNVLTGPAWRVGPDDVPGRLLRDLDELAVPILPEAVERIEARGEGFVVHPSGGGALRADAVVVATGLRRLCDERDGFGSRVSVTFQGADRFPALLLKAARAARASGRPLLVVGHGGTRALAPWVVRAAREAGAEVIWLLEDGDPRVPGARVVRGRLASAGPSEAIAEGPGGERIALPCGHVFIDYHAFEVRPSRCVELIPEPERTPSGHLRVDREGATSVPGIYAAGDCTGPYYAIARALGDGLVAGLSAWRHVLRGRFGTEPPLFAYRADGRPLEREAAWIPAIPADFEVDVLLPEGAFLRLCAARGLAGERLLSAPRRAGAWVEASGLAPDHLWEAIFEARAATVRPAEGEREWKPR